MSDEIPRRDPTDPAPEEHPTVKQPPVTEPAAEQLAEPAQPVYTPPPGDTRPGYAPPPVVGTRERWYQRRVPLLVTAAVLLLGCVLGCGIAAVGALVIGHHGDRGGFSRVDDRGPVGPGGYPGGDRRGGFPGDGGPGRGPREPQQQQPPQQAPAPATPTPAPSASS
jgi:hypothetical protein